MADIQPSIDLKKVNLQTAVGYLVSLHDNEYEWNLLGIKVVGKVETAADIPAGTYEYGDAFAVGTEEPYTFYIYTRPDGGVHTEDYWFPIGKFPMPGPKGDKGDGLEQINEFNTGTAQNITYDTTTGAEIVSNANIDYTDSTTGQTEGRRFLMRNKLPILPGKYVSIDANGDNDALEVKIDDTALALDYYKIDKSFAYPVIPVWSGNSQIAAFFTDTATPYSAVQRNSNGNTHLNTLFVDKIATTVGEYSVPTQAIYYGGFSDGFSVEKTSTDTGTLTAPILDVLKSYPNAGLKYDGQLYRSMDPVNAPDGTLNYIHIDSVQDGNGGYKATGKCFSITVSTRAWQVVDVSFGAPTTHYLYFRDNVSNNGYYFTLTTDRATPYETSDIEALRAAMQGKMIPCVFRKGTDSDKVWYSGILQTTSVFNCNYGANLDFGMTTAQVTVTDNI